MMRTITFLALLSLLLLSVQGATIFKQRSRQQSSLDASASTHTKDDNFPALYSSLGSPPLTLDSAINLIKKVETAYPALSPVQITDSLRRLAGYDSDRFQTLLGTSAATSITPTGALTQSDIDLLRLMVSHDVQGGTEYGVVSQGTTQIALGHVICGLSAGHHRLTSVSISWVNNIGVGSSLDNLYAITLAGDIGQVAVFKNEGRQSTYIGPGTDATYPELIGDIDGLLIGDSISRFTGRKVSEVLDMYYVNPPATLTVKASHRYELLAAHSSTAILDHSIAFASNYKYSVFSKLTAPFRSMDSDVINAWGDVRVWAARQSPLTATQVRTMLQPSGSNYVHNANGATPLYYRKTAASWEWSVDNQNWQDVSLGSTWRGSLPSNVRAGDMIPVINNIRIINFLRANPSTSI